MDCLDDFGSNKTAYKRMKVVMFRISLIPPVPVVLFQLASPPNSHLVTIPSMEIIFPSIAARKVRGFT